MSKKIAAKTKPSAVKSGAAVASPMVVAAVETLRARGQTISFAESCTGGLLSAIFTRMPGVSDVFAGSLVAYSYPVKETLLQVPRPMLRAMGAVSLPVARKMAAGAQMNLGTTWSIAITGVAGPGGGTPAKPVGTVCFAIRGPGVEEAVQKNFEGTRREVQLASAKFALMLLLKELGVGRGLLSQAESQPKAQSKLRSSSRKNH